MNAAQCLPNMLPFRLTTFRSTGTVNTKSVDRDGSLFFTEEFGGLWAFWDQPKGKTCNEKGDKALDGS